MELLVVDETTREIHITAEAMQMQAFKSIIDKDKSKNKSQAFKKLAFVRLIEHPLSPFMDTEPDKRAERIKDFLQLEMDDLDAEVLTARKVYKKLVESSTSKTVSAIRDGLYSTVKLIDKSSKLIEALLDEAEPDRLADPAERQIVLEGLLDANKLLDSILDKATKVPEAIETLDHLAEKLKKQMATKRNIRGKGSINVFEE